VHLIILFIRELINLPTAFVVFVWFCPLPTTNASRKPRSIMAVSNYGDKITVTNYGDSAFNSIIICILIKYGDSLGTDKATEGYALVDRDDESKVKKYG
jgi:hypothetical protein